MALSTTKKAGMGAPTKVLLALGFLGAVAAGLWLNRELTLPPQPTAAIAPDLPAIGRKTTVKVTVTASEGVWAADVKAEGSALKAPVTSVLRAAGPAAEGQELPRELTFELVLGKEAQPDLVPGQVVITVNASAAPTRLRTPPAVTQSVTLEVKLDPPALAATSQFVHPTQGGAEAIVYEVGPSSVKDGVQVGDWFFPGSSLPSGAPSQRFVLFAVPYDMDMSEDEAKAKVKLVAEDVLGNRAEARFVHKFFPRPMGKDIITLKDTFMEKVTGEIFARTPELQKPPGLLEGYLKLNGELRKKNNDELKVLAASSKPSFLWKQTFLPMQNAAVKGSFADRRTYRFEDKDVDQQDHLGFDLASVERAPVQSANDGVVVLARYMGIFGNCVIVDHGFGLMSLNAHLSTIGVKEGEAVTRGQELGKTGATGLAGGDHLHFTMLLHGLPVTPIEWWDGHWIQDRLKLKLGDALPWAG
jgi:murein DD-endopeptidase MepM/ murein hydrolase activator NlpD